MAGARAIRKSPSPSAPQIKKGLPEVFELHLGNSVCLECHVDGYPRPEVKWEKDGKSVMKSRNVHMMRSGDRCVLQINNLREKDLGLYKCIATNMIGTVIIKTTICFANSKTPKISNNHINSDLKTSQTIRSCGLDTEASQGVISNSHSKISKSLKIPETLFCRSRSPSSERRSVRTSSATRASKKVYSEKTNKSQKEINNIFNRLYNASECRKNDSTCKENGLNIDNNIKNSINNSQSSIASRLIAKVKIPNIFKQQEDSTDRETRQRSKLQSTVIANKHERDKTKKISHVPSSRRNSLETLSQSLKDLHETSSKSTKSNLNTWSKTVREKSNKSRKPLENGYVKSQTEIRHVNSQNQIGFRNSQSDIKRANLQSEIERVNLQSEIEQLNSQSEIGQLNLRNEIEHANFENEIECINLPNGTEHFNIQNEIGHENSENEIERVNSENEIRHVNSENRIGQVKPQNEIGYINNQNEIARVNLSCNLQSEIKEHLVNGDFSRIKFEDITLNKNPAQIPKDNKTYENNITKDIDKNTQQDHLKILGNEYNGDSILETNFKIRKQEQQKPTETKEWEITRNENSLSDRNTLEISNKIADKMLLNIGISPKISNKFIQEYDELVIKYREPEENTAIVDDRHVAENKVSRNLEKNRYQDNKKEECNVHKQSVRETLKWRNETIPTICIQQSTKDGDDLDDITITHNIENKVCNNFYINGDLDDFHTGSIRYLTTPIEEECEDLTSTSMTPIGDVNGSTLCEVQESAGRREQVEVDFQQVVSPSESSARIVRGPQSVTVLRGESVTLAIHFNGVPTPNIIWIKGGTTLSDGGRTSILSGKDMSVLSINKVTADDSGKYVVCVENGGGGDSCFASVAVVGFPEPPGGEPTASDFTDHSLVLSWYGSMYDGGSVVTGYVVEMCQLSDRKWQKVASCENTSYIIQGLSCGQRYIFRVRAENKYGLSCPSKESQTICLDDYLGEKYVQNDEIVEHKDPVSIEVGVQVSDKYELKEVVGKGRFGTVYRCIEATTGRPRAAKVIRCIRVKDKEKVRQEVDIMNQLNHPKLLRIFAAFESGRNMIMITEFISGGELFERVIADDFVLTESDCIAFMKQICDGVAYMHKNSIIHLDLKPENILCKTRTSHQIKIIDFGLARPYDVNENLRILFGTPEFVAPEVINYEPVGPASDMWSVGVICYVLLSGLSPFMGDTDSETFANITRGEIDFDDEAFLTISQEAKDFISILLVKAPNKRLSATQCLKHQWLKQAHEWIHSRDLPISTEKLKKFIIRRKWQKSGTAIRALGRMVSMSRSSGGSSFESSPSISPTSSRSRSFISSRSETAESADSEVFKDSDSADLSR